MPSRARKALVAGVVGIATLVAGVAFASFVSSQDFGGNGASGGKLTVDASGLPLQFPDGSALYPTDCDHPDNGAVETSSFSITNNNPVSVSYGLKSALGDTANPTPDADQTAQYDNLCVTISVTTPGTATHKVPGQSTPLDSPASPQTSVLYHGKLKDLDGSVADLLGTLGTKQSQTYDVVLMLQNVPGADQKQEITTPFTLTVRAETPVSSTSTAAG